MKRKSHVEFEEILTDREVERDVREIPIKTNVFLVFLALIILIAIGICAQIIALNVGKKDAYVARALDNVSDTKIKYAPRGEIEDRFGNTLTENIPSFNVFLVPKKLPQDISGREAAIRRIAEILDMPEWELVKKIEDRDWSLSEKMLLANDVTQDQLVELSSAEYLGVSVEESFRRSQKTLYAFSELIGYTGLVGKDDIDDNSNLTIDDVIGRSGLEAQYDNFLRGINGKEVTYKNAKGEMKIERVEREPKPGKNVKTNIDLELQNYFYTRLKDQLKSLGRDVGVGVAINPSNGEVLALTSVPGFDTAHIGDALVDSRRPLFNRVVGGLYNPGSTIKPLVGIGALTDGIMTPITSIFSKGYIEIPNPYNPDHPSRFVDWKPQGWVNIRSALARSSNVYFYEVGGGFENQKGLGVNGLKKWWETFGLSRKTEIDLPGEKTGFLPDPEWKEKKTGEPWRIGDTYNVSIGQGDFSITPIELINYIAAVANGGTFYKPRVMDSIIDSDGNEIVKTYPSVLFDIKNKITPESIHEVREGMRDAVTESYGTAHLLNDIPMPIGAKTGTAQIQNNTKTNAFFVGFAPFDNPQIAILVLIENAREGSSNTIPVAKDVLMWYYSNRLKVH